MTTRRRIMIEVTVDEAASCDVVLAAVMSGLSQYGPPGETRVLVAGVPPLVEEITVLRAPEDRREGVRAQGDE